MHVSAAQLHQALLTLVAFIVSVTVHEFGHALVADRLGDRLPRSQGRVTLSPLPHIDMLGTIIMPLAGAFLPGGFPLIAWGKPVQTNPRNYTARLPQRVGHMLVALAGPAMNVAMALGVSVVFLALGKSGHLSATVANFMIQNVLALNIVLAVFNLIPVPPLDGAAVLAGFLPERLQFVPRALQRYGMLLFFGLFLSGVLRVVMRPAYQLVNVWTDALLRSVGA